MTLDSLIAELQSVRARIGADAPVFMETPGEEHEIMNVEAFRAPLREGKPWLVAISALEKRDPGGEADAAELRCTDR